MSLRVLAVMPSSVAMSADVAEGFPEGLSLDPDFPFIPISGNGPQLTAAFGDESNRGDLVAVRGYIEADPEDPPYTMGDYAIYSDPDIAPFITCGNDPAVGTHEDVASLLNVQGLWDKGYDGNNVAIAILDTGINVAHLESVLGWAPYFDADNSWAPSGLGWSAGDAPVDHGTMCAFDALIAATNATLLDYPILTAPSHGGGSVMTGALSNALLAFSTIYASWTSGAGSGDLSQYSGLVLNNSWGIYHPSWDFPAGHPGRYCDNPNHPFILQLETMSRGGIDVFFAAGNCGADCPSGRCQGRVTEAIMGASASVDAMCIAGCDINQERVGYSSQGPSISGMYGMKPDATAYTHFLGSKAFGDTVPDNGTSAACPVAAGCMAALRTLVDPRSPADPYMMYSHFRDQATTPPNGTTGWNGDYGYGIVDAVAVGDLFN